MPILEIRDVHKWYGDFHVLNGISETVEKGEVVFICGPSGSGKSTFIRYPKRIQNKHRENKRDTYARKQQSPIEPETAQVGKGAFIDRPHYYQEGACQ